MLPIKTLILRLILVLFIGGLVGIERELKTKSAGFRTIMLICMGSFLFTTFSYYISPQTPDRIASNIVTGIGFLGAGVIFRGDNKVTGLTTAATIWVTAALGMGVATGMYLFVSIATGLVLASLLLMVRMERWIDKKSIYRNYTITFPNHHGIVKEYQLKIVNFKLHSDLIKQIKDKETITVCWNIKGSSKNHQLLTDYLFQDISILKVEV